ncbi:MAG: DUF3575 domain-containing protein [Muribaculaceae bacterium]|nr:DUF3575 domain-containing protein [Muribaculaceae bacterium]
MKTHILTLLCIFIGTFSTFAESEKDSVKVHFHVSKTNIDRDFYGNGATLDSIFSKLIADSISSPTHRLIGVKVTGAASPEGSVDFNKYLSEKRAKAIFNEFRSRGLLEDSLAVFTYIGRDWNGLKSEVEADGNVPYQRDVELLLERITGPNPPSHPLTALKALHHGEPYRYLHTYLFPELRASRLTVEYERLFPDIKIPDIQLDAPEISSYIITDDILPLPYNCLGEVKECKPFYMGIKTNMLYDALLLPNIGAEFYVGKNISLTADWMYGWWDRDRSHYYWRAYGGNIGARWWFGKKAHEKPLTGHHLGLFAGVVTYDFELGKGGIMGGIPRGTLWDRCNFISGIEYGYSLPVARRLNIDFSLAFGYMAGKYLKYEPKYGFYIWQSTHHLRWLGPTKAEISLVWLIGCDNYNRTKGGKR